MLCAWSGVVTFNTVARTAMPEMLKFNLAFIYSDPGEANQGTQAFSVLIETEPRL
jgi:hypothetical protein